MKKQVKKLISDVLDSTMAVTGVAVTNFAVTPVSVLAASNIAVYESSGWMESCYVEWIGGDSSYTGYNVYVKNTSDSDWTKLDDQLIRKYPDCWRADAVGLAAGTYNMKVVPVSAGTEVTADAITTSDLTVTNYDRSGAAFSTKSTYKGAGAYNADGTLKAGAKVIYVTPENAKTVKASIMQDKAEQEFTGLQAIVNALQKGKETAPVDIRIVGMINADDMDSFASKAEGLQIKGKNAYSNLNLTIEGIGEDAGIHGFGMLIRNAGNVELRNFAVMACLDDSVSLDTSNCNVWVHNMDLFYGQTGGDADQAKGDGTVDVKGKSTFVTVSYNHFFDSGKSSLCGMKGETTDCQITYHHNWFDHSDSRHPRIRTMSVHIYNNYFDGNAKYGVGTTMGSSAFVEANYFRNCKYPMLSSKQGTDATGDGTFSGETGGMIKAYNNHIEGAKAYLTQNNPNATTGYDAYEVTERSAQVPSSEVTKAGGTSYNNFDTDTSKFDLGVDTANIDAPEDVPAKVMAQAGRVNGGDFKWTFNNATEDTNYAVISELKSAVVNYKSSIVSFGGNSDGTVVTTGATTTTEATTETTTSSVNPTETTTEAQIEISTVDLTAKDGFSPSTATPAAGSISVEYQSATDDYLLKDTSDVAAATWTNSFEPITSGKVIVKGYATPVIAKAAGKWAFVQVKGTNKAGDSADIADLASDASKNIALRTGSSAYTSTSDTIASTKYNYEFVFDLDAQTVTLTVNDKTLTHSIDAQSISSVVGITANSAVDRNLIMSKPTVGVPTGGTTPTETTTAKTTDATTETTTAVVTEATTKVTDATTETTTAKVTDATTETTTNADVPSEPHKGGGDINEHQLPAIVDGTDTSNTRVIFDNAISGKVTVTVNFDASTTEGTGALFNLVRKDESTGTVAYKDTGIGLRVTAKDGSVIFDFGDSTGASAGKFVAGSNTVVFTLDTATGEATCTLNGGTTVTKTVTGVDNIAGIKANKKKGRTLTVKSIPYSVEGGEITTETTTVTTTETTTETTTVTETSSETTTEAPAPEPSKNVKGDADGNGKVEANDAALVLQKVLTGAKVALEDVATNAFELLDADKDGQLTAKDAAYILQKALDSTFTMPNEK